ncbi:response regulator [Amphritea sp. 2_MG-2023]|uniref:response regulator n=1 Tax=Amphritea TaxID=515417 RepID=UPI0026E2D363|nr:response regulator [Amphritea sp. 2_MG-2023]MDO6419563.1 response regulator [Amphritea sp. 2_MG-2023]MDX2424182.1 response regulator [Amphritea sp.]
MHNNSTDSQIDYSDKHVLLIDSSGNMRATIYYMLRELGISNVKAVTINDKVIPLIAQSDFDVILLGHNASDSVTGIQILEEARFRGFIKPSAAWVCMTSDSSQEVILHAIDSQPDDLITKPFSIEELKYRLDHIMRRKQALRPVDLAIESGARYQALQICEALIDRQHPEYNHLQKVRGTLLLDLGEYEKARELFDGIYWESRDKEAGLYLCRAYCGLDDLTAAEQLLQELINDNPLLIAAYDLLAEVHEKMGDLVQARETLKEATTRAPLGIPRQMELGRVAIQTQELDLAKGAYRRSISLGKKSCYRSAEPYLKLANLRRMEVKSSDDNAREQIEREIDGLLISARQQFSADRNAEVRAFLIRSQLAEDLGDDKEKERFLRDAKLINRELDTPVDIDRELLVMSGEALPVLEKVEEVPNNREVYAKQINPDMSDKANRLGIKHYLSGKVGLAIKSFGAAVDFDFNNHSSMLNLAQLFLETARNDNVRREGRLKMVDRYLNLVERAVLKPEQNAKKILLKKYRQMPLTELPTSSLGPLLK